MSGRPSEYSVDVAADICARLAAGEPLVKICRDESMPSVRSVYYWLNAHEDFLHMYARAREDQADTLADEIIDIADSDPATVFDTINTKDGASIEFARVDGAAVNHQRLRVDARKWIASKLKPRKYGEMIRQELSGSDGAPISHKVEVFFVDPSRDSKSA